MRRLRLGGAAMPRELPDAEAALRWVAVWSAPWVILAAVWGAGEAAPHFSEDGDGRPYLTYMAPDGRLHPGPPPGASCDGK